MTRWLPLLMFACTAEPDELVVTLESFETGPIDTAAGPDTGTDAPADTLAASPPTLDLGDVVVDCEHRGEVTLRHGGPDTLPVVVALGSGSFTPRFAIVEPRPVEVAPGTGTPVGITFHTAEPGPRQATLSVTATDAAEPLQVLLRAQSRPTGACGGDTDTDPD